jgi:hypothetical protein
VKIIISRANDDGTFPTVGTNNRLCFSGVVTERCAIERGTKYAQGRAFRVEFWQDGEFYKPDSKPFRTIEQTAFPGFSRHIFATKEGERDA